MAKARISMNRRTRASRFGKRNSPPKRVPLGKARGKSLASLSERKSIEQLAAEQGIKPTKLEDILGKGADLWESDQEFEKFVADIYARRREDRERAKQ